VDATPEETPFLIFGVEIASLLEEVSQSNTNGGGSDAFNTTGGGDAARKNLGAVGERHVPILTNAHITVSRLALDGRAGEFSSNAPL